MPAHSNNSPVQATLEPPLPAWSRSYALLLVGITALWGALMNQL
ncbi:MAG TPA: hypothetical protein VFN67_03965 [Polyangiales bacterium]|jgi:hypothetical protein|nr:hypothetical protein [Polyangiales bacterium]